MEYLERTSPGDKGDASFLALMTTAHNVDTVIAQAHARDRLQGVNVVPASDNTVQVGLNLISCTYHALLHGDSEGARQLLAFRPPGTDDLLPQWAVNDARQHAKAGYQEMERRQHGFGSAPVANTGPPLVNTIRQRAVPTKGPKAPRDSPDKGPKSTLPKNKKK